MLGRIARGIDPDLEIIRLLLDDRALELAQPGADRKPKFFKPCLPDVEVSGLLDGKPQAWRAMFQHCGRNPESWIVDKDAMTYRDRAHGFGREGCLEAKPYRLRGDRGPDFGHHESQITGFTIRDSRDRPAACDGRDRQSRPVHKG